MEIWTTILTALGGSSIGAVVIGWLAKTLLTKKFREEVIWYKSKLDGELEGIKAEYQAVIFQKNTQFSKMYEAHAFAIKEIYLSLVNVEITLDVFTAPLKNSTENTQQQGADAAAAINSFYRISRENMIWFSPVITNLLNEIHMTCKSIFVDHDMACSINNMKEKFAWIKKARNDLHDTLPRLREECIQEFQRILHLNR